jgi:hypothetical protein
MTRHGCRCLMLIHVLFVLEPRGVARPIDRCSQMCTCKPLPTCSSPRLPMYTYFLAARQMRAGVRDAEIVKPPTPAQAAIIALAGAVGPPPRPSRVPLEPLRHAEMACTYCKRHASQ